MSQEKRTAKFLLRGMMNQMGIGLETMLVCLVELFDEDYREEYEQGKDGTYLKVLRDNTQKTLDDYRKRYDDED